MATDIPTFRSDRTTQIPTMGIVSLTGTGAVARAIGEKARVFDQIGAYANKKADEFMERENRLAAEKAVREGGLDPAKLSSPVTAADRIYREAALNTYAIKVEDDIDRNLNRLYSESKYNPAGFQTKASAYLKGTIGGLAPELQNGVSKFALADIRKKQFSLELELKEKIRAESAAATQAKLEQVATRYVNAETPDDRQTALIQAAALIDGDPTSITSELKSAKLEEFTRKITMEAQVTDVMNGRIDPLAATQALRDAGIAVTPEVQRRIYGSYGVHEDFELKRQQAARAASLEQAEQVEDALYATLLNPDTSLDDMRAAKEQAAAALTSLGVGGKDKYNILTAYEDSYLDNIKPSPEIIAYYDSLVESLEPGAEAEIKRGVAEGAIPAQLALEKLVALRDERGSIRSNSYFKQYEAEFLQQKYPLAVFYKDINAVPQASRDEWQIQTVAYQNSVRQINELVNNPDPKGRMSIEDAIAKQRGTISQTIQENQAIKGVPITNPERPSIQQMIVDEAPTMRIYDSSAPKQSGKMIDYNPKKPGDIKIPPHKAEFEPFFSGPMTRESAAGRIRFFLMENAAYYRDNPDGKNPPYSINTIQGIQDAFNIKDEELE